MKSKTITVNTRDRHMHLYAGAYIQIHAPIPEKKTFILISIRFPCDAASILKKFDA